MMSIYDEISAKLRENPSLIHRNGPRVDLGLLLFGARDDLRDLWVAADRCCTSPDPEAMAKLKAAVETLKPLFGER